MTGTSSPDNVCTKLDRIAMLARRMPGVALTTLAHHIDVDWMREAYRRTRKDAAPGVDGQSSAEYAVDLESNLQALLGRLVVRKTVPRFTGARRPAPRSTA